TSEGTGKVSMLDLMVNSLRMRPDRIIVGEIRRAEEAEVLFEAMHTGHSVYATLHAETVDETIRRLHNPPINIPPMLLQSLHLIVAMYRDRRRNVRRTFEIGEVIPSEEKGVYANVIYRWRPNRDELLPFEQIIRFNDIIKMYANIDDDGIKNDLEEKKTILEWISKNNINNIEDVGNIISLYYDDKEELMKMIKLNKVPHPKQE
ncbi:MAG: ATPase, T2SS/T4P/T4SS family, partial [Candidatus Anstonellales archaeon]